jgi:hypothetical protein
MVLDKWLLLVSKICCSGLLVGGTAAVRSSNSCWVAETKRQSAKLFIFDL